MDSVTHIVLGACVGETLLGQKIGKKGLLIGAIAQSIPDIDFITFLWLSPAEQLLAHRGFTHSFLFVILITPLAALLSRPLLGNKVGFQTLAWFFLIELLAHLFLDAFNNYGIGWCEPFSDIRISFNMIYVADVLMTIVPVVAFIILLVLPTGSGKRKWWSRFGIGWSVWYLSICVLNKAYINEQVSRVFEREHIHHVKYFTTPAPMQSLLWMVVVGNDSGYYVGYRSVLDTDPKIQFQYFPANKHLLSLQRHHRDVVVLQKFSRGYYTIEQWGDTLVFNDLRFGQIAGWHDPKEKFVFHYFLQHEADNRMVVQRGRLSNWTPEAVKIYLKRIWGN